MPGVLWHIPLTERGRGRTDVCVEDKEVGVSENHQSAQVGGVEPGSMHYCPLHS